MEINREYPIRSGDVLEIDGFKVTVDEVLSEEQKIVKFRSSNNGIQKINKDKIPYNLVRRKEDFNSKITLKLRGLECLITSQIKIHENLDVNIMKYEGLKLSYLELKRVLSAVQSQLDSRGDRKSFLTVGRNNDSEEKANRKIIKRNRG